MCVRVPLVTVEGSAIQMNAAPEGIAVCELERKHLLKSCRPFHSKQVSAVQQKSFEERPGFGNLPHFSSGHTYCLII